MGKKRTEADPQSTETWIDLEDADYSAVGLRPRVVKRMPAAKRFDVGKAIASIERVKASPSTWVDFAKMHLQVAMTRAEANFWLTAMLSPYYDANFVLQAIKAAPSFDGEVPDLAARLSAMNHRLPTEAVVALMALYKFPGMVAWMTGLTSVSSRAQLIKGIRAHLLPYVTEADIYLVRPIVLGWLRRDPIAKESPAEDVMLLAAELGMHDEVASRLPMLSPFASRENRRDIVLRLGDADLLRAELGRKDVVVETQVHVRQCLAVAGLDCLDELVNIVMNEASKARAESLASALTRVHAPEMARGMLTLLRAGIARHVARGWFVDNPTRAAVGLAAFADDPGLDGQAARAVIAEQRRLSADNAASLPEDLAVVLPVSSRSHPTDPPLSTMPAVRVGDQPLGSQYVVGLFEALRQSTFENPHPYVTGLRRLADRRSLDAFALALSESWIGDGMPLSARWRFIGAGLLGGDGCVLKLGACIREWPGQSGHARAVLGLQCLLAIGTDEAFAELAAIAAHCKYEALKEKAAQTMEGLAAARGLTLDQLHDRVVPRCGLDQGGVRHFDYGAHRFRFVLSAELKPMLKNEDGLVFTDFPAPLVADDPDLVAQAKADWAIVKKQVAQIAKAQAERLERAMVTGRHWTAAEFQELTLAHPILSLLAQRVIWASCLGAQRKGRTITSSGKDSFPDGVCANERSPLDADDCSTCRGVSDAEATTFRVTEDFTLSNALDELWVLPEDARVGIVHPAALSPAERGVWGELLSDYEIIPPFRQLTREIHTLTPKEKDALDLTRLRGKTFDAVVGMRILGHKHWTSTPGDVRKVFQYYGVTALVHLGPGAMATRYGESLKVKRCSIYSGLHPAGQVPSDAPIPWGSVNPVVASEVIRDLLMVASKK